MADNTSKKTSWFKSLKAEFKKIVWPSRSDVSKQTAVVIVFSAILCIVLALVDWGMKQGINLLIG